MKRFLRIGALGPAVFILGGLFITGSGKAAAQTVFNADGIIAAGEKSIGLNKDGALLFQLGTQQLKFSLYFFKCNPQTGKDEDETFFTTVNLADKRLTVNTEKKETVFKGRYTDKESGLSFELTVSLSLQDDGSARVNISYDNDALFQKKLISRHAYYNDSMPFYLFDGQKVKVDDQEFLINRDTKETEIRPEPESVVLFAGNTDREITFLTDQKSIVFRITPGKTLALFLPENFGVKLAATGEKTGNPAPAVSNYYPSDQLSGPRYDLCRNLIQNPSFEAGFHDWQEKPHRYSESFRVIDPESAYRGRNSLRLEWHPLNGPEALTPVAQLYTLATPLEPNQEYTLSFYGKANRPQTILFYEIEGRNADTSVKNYNLHQEFTLTSEWQRYSTKFRARSNQSAFAVRIQGATNGDVSAWIDCIQLEKGGLTEYAEKPVCANLVTDRPDNLFQPKENINGRLEIATQPNMKGEVSLSLKDFFSRVVYRETMPFTADSKGFVALPVPLEKQNLSSGQYVLQADFTLSSGYRDQDWFRLGIMSFLNNDFRHKNMFTCWLYHSWENDTCRKRAERMKNIGIGAVYANLWGLPMAPVMRRELDRNHILDTNNSAFRGGSLAGEFVDQSELVGKPYGKQPGEIVVSEEGGGKNSYRPETFTPEVLKKIEEWACRKAQAHPEIREWKLANEPMFWLKDDLAAMKQYVPVMQAAHDGIKRADPKLRVLSPDPPGMGVEGGIKWLDTYIQAGGLTTFDIAAIHPYRQNPESPDMDRDISDFIAMLERHGYQGDIWFTEGGGWMHYLIPAYRLDPDDYLGAWDYWCDTISYDQGYGEKLVAAYLARTWVVCLKHADRVKMQLVWVPNMQCMDLNMTPRADSWVTNTLGHVLGNADFCQDIAVTDDIRGFLFEDDQKRPVAVFYNISPAVNRRAKEAPAIQMPFAKAEVEIIDLMGKSRPSEKTESLAVTPFPVFVRGKAGTRADFTQKITRELSGADVLRVKPEVKVTGETQAEVILQNTFSEKISGRVKIDCQDKTMLEQSLTLDGQKTVSLPVALPDTANTFQPIKLGISFQESGKSQVQQKIFSFPLLTVHKLNKPVLIDGDLSDWDEQCKISLPDTFTEFKPPKDYTGPTVPWKGKPDLAADLYAGWDNTSFYLAVKVIDDTFASPPANEKQPYLYDSLQVYFDTLFDGRTRNRTLRQYDGDDYNYDFWPLKEGAQVIRTQAAEWQLSFLKPGPAPEVKRAFRKTDDGYILEMAFPAKQIFPVALSAGSSFGFALLINDNDNDYRKRGLTITPAGTEPCQNPDLYPAMVLVE